MFQYQSKEKQQRSLAKPSHTILGLLICISLVFLFFPPPPKNQTNSAKVLLPLKCVSLSTTYNKYIYVGTYISIPTYFLIR